MHPAAVTFLLMSLMAIAIEAFIGIPSVERSLERSFNSPIVIVLVLLQRALLAMLTVIGVAPELELTEPVPGAPGVSRK